MRREAAESGGSTARQVEPVPGEAVETVREPAPVALDMDESRFVPEGPCRGEDGYGRGRPVEAVRHGGDVGNDRMSLVGIDDIAPAELQQDLAADIGVPPLNGGQIGEADCLAVVSNDCPCRIPECRVAEEWPCPG